MNKEIEVNKSLKVICLFGGPGTGKSTIAAGLFHKMKTGGYNVELVTEFAKDRVYEGHLGCLSDQIYIFGNQQRRLKRLVGHVDYAITDSPLPLCILYNQENNDLLDELILQVYNSYSNFNFFLHRNTKNHPYSEVGRLQTESEACLLDSKLFNLLNMYSIDYKDMNVDENTVTNILSGIK